MADFNLNAIKQTDGLSPTSEILQRRQKLRTGNAGADTFGEMLNNAIDSVDGQMKDADKKVSDVVEGKSENIHDAMISMQKAQLSFQLMLEIRNKAVDTYKELSRMQI